MSNAALNALNACCWDAAIRVSGRYYIAWRRYSDFYIGYSLLVVSKWSGVWPVETLPYSRNTAQMGLPRV